MDYKTVKKWKEEIQRRLEIEESTGKDMHVESYIEGLAEGADNDKNYILGLISNVDILKKADEAKKLRKDSPEFIDLAAEIQFADKNLIYSVYPKLEKKVDSALKAYVVEGKKDYINRLKEDKAKIALSKDELNKLMQYKFSMENEAREIEKSIKKLEKHGMTVTVQDNLANGRIKLVKEIEELQKRAKTVEMIDHYTKEYKKQLTEFRFGKFGKALNSVKEKISSIGKDKKAQEVNFEEGNNEPKKGRFETIKDIVKDTAKDTAAIVGKKAKETFSTIGHKIHNRFTKKQEEERIHEEDDAIEQNTITQEALEAGASILNSEVDAKEVEAVKVEETQQVNTQNKPAHKVSVRRAATKEETATQKTPSMIAGDKAIADAKAKDTAIQID